MLNVQGFQMGMSNSVNGLWNDVNLENIYCKLADCSKGIRNFKCKMSSIERMKNVIIIKQLILQE